jgi:hypothetical protein
MFLEGTIDSNIIIITITIIIIIIIVIIIVVVVVVIIIIIIIIIITVERLKMYGTKYLLFLYALKMCFTTRVALFSQSVFTDISFTGYWPL